MTFDEVDRWVKILKRCGWVVLETRLFPSSQEDDPGGYGIIACDPKSPSLTRGTRMFLSADDIQATLGLYSKPAPAVVSPRLAVTGTLGRSLP